MPIMQEKKTALIVDDTEGVRRVIQEFLKFHGFKVYGADNGISALNLIEKHQFDIIITDYSMPGMNGIELTNAIRSRKPHVLIIGMSGRHTEKDFLNAGANAFLPKPLQLEQLLSLCHDFTR